MNILFSGYLKALLFCATCVWSRLIFLILFFVGMTLGASVQAQEIKKAILSPETCSSDGSGWWDIMNLLLKNDEAAKITLNVPWNKYSLISPELKCTGYKFDFNNKDINQIEIEGIGVTVKRRVEALSGSGSSSDKSVTLLSNRVKVGKSKEGKTIVESFQESHFGGSQELWDYGEWNAAKIKNGELGVSYDAQVSSKWLGSGWGIVHVDYIEIEVYYFEKLSSSLCDAAPPTIPGGRVLSCTCDEFNRKSLNSEGSSEAWLPSNSDGKGNPSISQIGYLQLTKNEKDSAKAVTLNQIFPSKNNYVSVEIEHYAYGGGAKGGGDGMAVVLSDFSTAAVPGAFGGSLGYAQKTGSACGKSSGCPGFKGGWLGVGIDEFGNFRRNTEGRVGGESTSAPSVSVRGGEQSNYKFLTGKALSEIDAPGSPTRARGHRYQVIVDTQKSSSVNQAEIVVRRSFRQNNGRYQQYEDVVGTTNTEAIPENLKVSFTASTGGSTNFHELGAVRVCAISSSPMNGGVAKGFSAIDEAYGSPPIGSMQPYQTGHIYTKLIGESFKLNVAAIGEDGLLNSYVLSGTKSVNIKLVDNSDGTCTASCDATCKNKPPVEGGSQTLAFVKEGKGEKQTGEFRINAAYRNLIAIISDETETVCSIDVFSVRPKEISQLTLSSIAPSPKASSDHFWLTATLAGGYQGSLRIDGDAIKPLSPATVAGRITGSFNPATFTKEKSTAIGEKFTYSEVGSFVLWGAKPSGEDKSKRAVYDGMHIDPGQHLEKECEGQTTAACDARRQLMWTGVDGVSTQRGCVPGSYANVKNAEGKYGCNFGLSSAVNVGAFIPNHFEVQDVRLDNRSPMACSPASTFTYWGEPLQASFTLLARNGAGETTKNYTAHLAKLSLNDPKNFHLAALAVDDDEKLIANGGAQVQPQLMSSAGNWNQGIATATTLRFFFTRLASPVAPQKMALGIAPIDSDGVTILPGAYGLPFDAGSAQPGVPLGASELRYGRIKLGNANGSDKLDLSVPVRVEYWSKTAKAWRLNAVDTCTVVEPKNFSLSSCETVVSRMDGQAPVLSAVLRKPAAVGQSVSVDLTLNLTEPADRLCPLQGTATSLNQPWLQFDWLKKGMRNPQARATFGTYKGVRNIIYFRENFY